MSQGVSAIHDELAAALSAGTPYPATPIEVPARTTKIRIRFTPATGGGTFSLIEGPDGSTYETKLEKGVVLVEDAGYAWEIPTTAVAGRSIRVQSSTEETGILIIQSLRED